MSSRTRSLIIILLFVALCASLVGCGRKGDPVPPEPVKVDEPAAQPAN